MKQTLRFKVKKNRKDRKKKLKIKISSQSILEVKKFRLTNETEQRQTREKDRQILLQSLPRL